MYKISFLVSAYKSERFMDRRLRNLLSEQSDRESEVIVIDSNSPENEQAIVEKWQGLFPDRLRYIRQSERTPYGVSWIEGWKIARGKFVCNANTDDFCRPNFTSTVFDNFSKSNSAFCYTGIHVINELGETLGGGLREPFNRELMSRECHAGPCVAWQNSKEFIDSLNWSLMERRAWEYMSAFDYWLWLMFLSLGHDGLAIPDILTIYTQRPGSIENSNKGRNNWETYAAISEFFPKHFQPGGRLYEEASEFADFGNLPEVDDWVAQKQKG